MKINHYKMKNYFKISILLLAGVLIIFSCSKDDKKNSTPPALTFKTGQYLPGVAYINKDTSLSVSSPFAIGFTASSTSDANLRSVLIKRVHEDINTDTVLYRLLTASTFSVDTLVVTNSSVGTEDFFIIISDQNGMSTTSTFSIVTTTVGPDITTYLNKVLGAQVNNSTGSFFASDGGIIYMLADAKTNSENIDCLYFYAATNPATIAAPNDGFAASVYNDPTNGLLTWDVRKATKFKLTTINSNTFDAITSSAQLATVVAIPLPSESKISNLTAGKVLGFLTQSGKLGLIRVDAISGTDHGTITISVKVQ